eukprot:TRINITY_DN28916_c0_g1_i1.p1 TRINITY_DN28916_c0_g1~~TRINITY_DN28916_c0_g1_i1.p1  ORF type:complete len:557 (+),score=76.37 TRINITY_DN28916_c0_g1_i1:65-1735(+)
MSPRTCAAIDCREKIVGPLTHYTAGTSKATGPVSIEKTNSLVDLSLVDLRHLRRDEVQWVQATLSPQAQGSQSCKNYVSIRQHFVGTLIFHSVRCLQRCLVSSASATNGGCPVIRDATIADKKSSCVDNDKQRLAAESSCKDETATVEERLPVAPQASEVMKPEDARGSADDTLGVNNAETGGGVAAESTVDKGTIRACPSLPYIEGFLRFFRLNRASLIDEMGLHPLLPNPHVLGRAARRAWQNLSDEKQRLFQTDALAAYRAAGVEPVWEQAVGNDGGSAASSPPPSQRALLRNGSVGGGSPEAHSPTGSPQRTLSSLAASLTRRKRSSGRAAGDEAKFATGGSASSSTPKPSGIGAPSMPNQPSYKRLRHTEKASSASAAKASSSTGAAVVPPRRASSPDKVTAVQLREAPKQAAEIEVASFAPERPQDNEAMSAGTASSPVATSTGNAVGSSAVATALSDLSIGRLRAKAKFYGASNADLRRCLERGDLVELILRLRYTTPLARVDRPGRGRAVGSSFAMVRGRARGRGRARVSVSIGGTATSTGKRVNIMG